uniref:Uncharacterized protein n=1 Tax=Meloidogyne enterolobii TaxID=390850 RepID=A0A6V7XWU0_MELEN|nr:unnamed protein product [Meloidogyne enterolobii]
MVFQTSGTYISVQKFFLDLILVAFDSARRALSNERCLEPRKVGIFCGNAGVLVGGM